MSTGNMGNKGVNGNSSKIKIRNRGNLDDKGNNGNMGNKSNKGKENN